MKKKKINIFKKIFDYRYFPYDFVKITGALPALIYLRLKKHYLNGKKQKGLLKGKKKKAAPAAAEVISEEGEANE